MQWLHGLKSEHKVLIPLSILMPLIIVLEIYAPSFEWKVLINVLHEWFTGNSSFLLRCFIWVTVLVLLYGLFFHEKLPAFFKQFPFEALRPYRFIPILLVGIVEGFVIFNFWVEIKTQIEVFGEEDPRWAGSFFTMIVAAPIAFFIWTFRNTDKRKDLQHIEENIRRENFHKIEKWATTFSTDTTLKKNG